MAETGEQSSASCEICGSFRRGYHTTYEASDTADQAPEPGGTLFGLIYPDESVRQIFADRDDRILECPRCHTLHLYRKRTPGGSDDAMRTNIHEYLDPVDPETAVNEVYKVLLFMRHMAKEYRKFFRQSQPGLESAVKTALAVFKQPARFPAVSFEGRRREITCNSHSIVSWTYPGENPAWSYSVAWKDIVRICYQCSGLTPDIIFIFTSFRPESLLVRTGTEGAKELWSEILDLKLFDAGLAARIAISGKGLYCWPGPKKNELPPESGEKENSTLEKFNQLLDPDLSDLI